MTTLKNPSLLSPSHLEVYSGTDTTRIRWSGVFVGTIAAITSYLALTVLGFAVGISNVPNADSVSSVAIPTAIWTVLSLGVAAYLGGTTAARAVGLHGHSRGRFNGLITGMVVLALLTMGASSLLSSGIRAVMGVTSSVVSTATSALGNAAGAVNNASSNAGGAEGLLNNLGLGNIYQSISSGLNEKELTQLINDAEPALNQAQVSAAVDTVGNVVRYAGRNITKNLGNLSDLGAVVTHQVEGVTTALSGPEFVARLKSRGLSQTQATQVAAVVNTRVKELQTQGQQAAEALAKATKDAAQMAANTASSLAWIWLLAAGIILGMATFGGGRDNTPETVPAKRV